MAYCSSSCSLNLVMHYGPAQNEGMLPDEEGFKRDPLMSVNVKPLPVWPVPADFSAVQVMQT